MKYLLLCTCLFLTCCSGYSNSTEILPEPEKPKLNHIQWNDIDIDGKHYYSITDADMDILNNNLIDLLDYERKQQLLIKYYEHLK